MSDLFDDQEIDFDVPAMAVATPAGTAIAGVAPQDAMKMALEALDAYAKSGYVRHQHPKKFAAGVEAANALRAALAASEVKAEPVAEVAWLADRPDTMLEIRCPRLWELPVGTKLYTHPPAPEQPNGGAR